MELSFNTAVLGQQVGGIRQFAEKARTIEDCVSLTIGEPDLNTPEVVKDAAKAALDANDTHYADGNGFLYVREAISEFEAKQNNLHYTPDEIIVTNGATEGLFASLFTILNPGDEVIIPTPAFGLYESITQLCRGIPVLVPTQDTDFQLTAEKLKAAITPKTKAVVLTSPNNPTGCILTKEALKELHDVLKNKPIFVLCDDVYRQMVYTDDYISFSNFEDMHDRIIVLQSFSKPYAMTGWRAGYLMADAPVRDRIQMFHRNNVVCPVSFIQPACVAALAYDNSAEMEIFHKRRDYVCNRLQGMGLTFNYPEGAFYAFPHIEKFGLDSLTFCTRMMEEAKVALVPGIYFGSEGYARLSYGNSDENLKKGLDRMEQFINAL